MFCLRKYSGKKTHVIDEVLAKVLTRMFHVDLDDNIYLCPRNYAIHLSVELNTIHLKPCVCLYGHHVKKNTRYVQHILERYMMNN